MSETPYDWSDEPLTVDSITSDSNSVTLSISATVQTVLMAGVVMFLIVLASSLPASYLWSSLVAKPSGIDLDTPAWFGLLSIAFFWTGVKATVSSTHLTTKMVSLTITTVFLVLAALTAAFVL